MHTEIQIEKQRGTETEKLSDRKKKQKDRVIENREIRHRDSDTEAKS